MESKEILGIVEAVQNEKNVAAEDVFLAIESALAVAARRNFDSNLDICIEIDRATGEYSTYRRWEVIDDDDENFISSDHQILLSAAKQDDESLNPW